MALCHDDVMKKHELIQIDLFLSCAIKRIIQQKSDSRRLAGQKLQMSLKSENTQVIKFNIKQKEEVRLVKGMINQLFERLFRQTRTEFGMLNLVRVATQCTRTHSECYILCIYSAEHST